MSHLTIIKINLKCNILLYTHTYIDIINIHIYNIYTHVVLRKIIWSFLKPNITKVYSKLRYVPKACGGYKKPRKQLEDNKVKDTRKKEKKENNNNNKIKSRLIKK